MLALCFYISWNYEWFLLNAAYEPPLMLALGVVMIVLVMEGLRRVSGWVLFSIVIVFMIYALVAHLVPAPLTGTRTKLDELAIYLAFDTNALIGIPLGVATTVVVIFIFMGQVLFNTGGGEFVTDIAMATMGHRRGGAAKISVLASGLFGTISGSAISNATTVGVVTIPLMKRAGYSAVDAGAIEANASTGGQFMPPVMGAAAFLMAEFLEIPYVEVVGGRRHPGAALLFRDLRAGRPGGGARPHQAPGRRPAQGARGAARRLAFHRALRGADLRAVQHCNRTPRTRRFTRQSSWPCWGRCASTRATA